MSGASMTLQPIEDIHPVADEAALLGHLHIAGILHHAWFIQVEDRDGEQVAVNDPFDRLGDLYRIDPDGAFRAVEIPGMAGEFVLLIYPGKT
jgi:hypothetical protein